MSIREIVNGDGEEDVEQGVVAKQGQHNEVKAGGDDDEDGDIDECSDDGGDGESEHFDKVLNSVSIITARSGKNVSSPKLFSP